PLVCSHTPLRDFFILDLRPRPRSTLFPYTTLFRSSRRSQPECCAGWVETMISSGRRSATASIVARKGSGSPTSWRRWTPSPNARSEEHTSELQSRGHLVCRLLLEKKKISSAS